MIVTCQSCGANERLEERFLAGRCALVRCSLCRGMMLAEALTNFETRRWWVGIAAKTCGPFTAREVKSLIEHGEIHGGSFMWTFGMTGWEMLDTSPRLAFAVSWYRELHLPYLEPVVGESIATSDATSPVNGGAQPAPEIVDPFVDTFVDSFIDSAVTAGPAGTTATPTAWFSARSALGEAGLHMAVAAMTLAVLGSGVAAGSFFA